MVARIFFIPLLLKIGGGSVRFHGLRLVLRYGSINCRLLTGRSVPTLDAIAGSETPARQHERNNEIDGDGGHSYGHFPRQESNSWAAYRPASTAIVPAMKKINL